MENLTEFYPAFKQVGLKKTGGKGCAIICKKKRPSRSRKWGTKKFLSERKDN